MKKYKKKIRLEMILSSLYSAKNTENQQNHYRQKIINQQVKYLLSKQVSAICACFYQFYSLMFYSNRFIINPLFTIFLFQLRQLFMRIYSFYILIFHNTSSIIISKIPNRHKKLACIFITIIINSFYFISFKAIIKDALLSTEPLLIQIFIFSRMIKELSQALITLQNSRQTEIPPFSTEVIDQIKTQLRRLNEEIKQMTSKQKQKDQNKTLEEKAFEKAKIALLFDQVYRIKRFLLLYFGFRCDRIQDQFWAYGGDLNNTEKGNLGEAEKTYFNNYKNIVMDYIEDVKVDLTIDLQPPIDIEVEYRMQKDCGEILDEFGNVIKLEKNSCGYIKKRLIEPFVKQGYATIKKK